MKATQIRIFLLLLAAIFTATCNKRNGEDAIVAEVGEKVLTIQQLSEVIPDNTNAADSVQLAQRYIQDWIIEQLVIGKAEQSLPDEKQNFEVLIENYRKSLLTYAYEQEWVRQKLDTMVTEEEIEKYYGDNEKNFQLKDYILKVKFCAIAADSKNVSQLRKLFNSTKPEDMVKWMQMCVDIGASYYFDEDKWLLWDEFTKQVPIEVYDVETFLQKKKSLEFEKDNNLYLLTVTDYQLSGSRSPLSFEREKIRSMIINRRKMELLEKMRQDLYSKALQDNEIKTYFGNQ
ncbi:MAG: hypothetical protein IPP69_14570 [Flavobacteriales bacterium]|nr:hypothetical protein [Flavobacteriales bacterium]